MATIFLSGDIDITTEVISSLNTYDPTLFRESIDSASIIDKEISDDSVITILLDYASDIKIIADELSTITEIVEIESPLNNEE